MGNFWRHEKTSVVARVAEVGEMRGGLFATGFIYPDKKTAKRMAKIRGFGVVTEVLDELGNTCYQLFRKR